LTDSGGGGSCAGKGYVHDDENIDSHHFGSPHSGGAPVLYADCSVHNYNYGYADGTVGNDVKTWQLLWAYNRPQVVAIP
jgi:prepilin-type processing-associated H-X9-DG protein